MRSWRTSSLWVMIFTVCYADRYRKVTVTPERSKVTWRAFQDRQYGSLEVRMRLQLVWPSASTCPHYSTAETDSTLTLTQCYISCPLCLFRSPEGLLFNWDRSCMIINNYYKRVSTAFLWHAKLQSYIILLLVITDASICKQPFNVVVSQDGLIFNYFI